MVTNTSPDRDHLGRLIHTTLKSRNCSFQFSTGDSRCEVWNTSLSNACRIGLDLVTLHAMRLMAFQNLVIYASLTFKTFLYENQLLGIFMTFWVDFCFECRIHKLWSRNSCEPLLGRPWSPVDDLRAFLRILKNIDFMIFEGNSEISQFTKFSKMNVVRSRAHVSSVVSVYYSLPV